MNVYFFYDNILIKTIFPKFLHERRKYLNKHHITWPQKLGKGKRYHDVCLCFKCVIKKKAHHLVTYKNDEKTTKTKTKTTTMLNRK